MPSLISSELTHEVVSRYKDCPDPRLKQIMESLVRHLHSFARDVNLTEAEWLKGIEFVTKVGQFSNETRQEFILLSDVLGLETTVVELNHGAGAGETEATLQRPFYVPGAPELPKGAMVEGNPLGDPLDVMGKIHDPRGSRSPTRSLMSGRRARTGFTRARTRTSQNTSCAGSSAPTATAAIISARSCRRAIRSRPTGRWAS
jgi:hydroxyquinol 1,2-dioxygenase